MVDYRLYHFGDGEKIVHWAGFSAPDDRMAVALCEDVLADLKMELWCGPRKVMDWPWPRPRS